MTRPARNPLLESSRLEAVWTMAAWLVATCWSVGFSTTYGYNRTVDDLQFVLGFPSWVFWGIIVPWGVCYVFSTFMAFGMMRDAPLEDDADTDASAHEVSAGRSSGGAD